MNPISMREWGHYGFLPHMNMNMINPVLTAMFIMVLPKSYILCNILVFYLLFTANIISVNQEG